MQLIQYFSLEKLKGEIQDNAFEINKHIHSVYSTTLSNAAQSLIKIMHRKRSSPGLISRDIEIVLNQIPDRGIKDLNKLVKKMRKMEIEFETQDNCNRICFNPRVFTISAHIINLIGIATSGTLASMNIVDTRLFWITCGLSTVTYIVNALAIYSRQRQDCLHSIDEVLHNIDYALQQTKGYEAVFKAAYQYLKRDSEAKNRAQQIYNNIDKAKMLWTNTVRKLRRQRSLSIKKKTS